MNGWFPKIHANGTICSGDAGIWITPMHDPPGQLSPVGLAPFWVGPDAAYNRNDKTTQVGRALVTRAYNDYAGSESLEWAGFTAIGSGHIDRYHNTTRLAGIDGVCAPRFSGPFLGWLRPWQVDASGRRELVIEDVVAAKGVILDWVPAKDGEFFLYSVATGTYTKQMWSSNGVNVGLTDREVPLVAFSRVVGEWWVVSGTGGPMTWVRPVFSSCGYRIPGDLYYPDARMLDGRLRVAGSSAEGAPRFNEWIDFTAPRHDLRMN